MNTATHVAERSEVSGGSVPEALVIAGLIGALYGPTLIHMVVQWWQDPDYSHGFVIPIFVGFVLYLKRHQVRQVSLKPSNFGFLLMLAAIGFLLGGTLGAELFVSRSSLLFLLAGMIIFFAGWKMLRAVAFPLIFLGLMIPLPALVYNQR